MRSRLGFFIAAALAALASSGAARAEDWPTRSIHVIVPLSAGSALDIIPRVVFKQVSQQLGQPIVIENRPGASGTIGARAVATASPDGYTFLAHSSAFVISPSTVANVPYDPLKDFVSVAPLGNLPNVLVISPSKNIKTIQELVEVGKKRPITFGSIGVGSPIQLAMERLRLSADFKVLPVSYRGAPEALVDTMSGMIDVYYSPILPALPLIREHKLVPLVLSSPTRAPTLPDVPTSLEAGYKNSEYRFWVGIFAPAKTPDEIVSKMNKEIEKALQVQAVRDELDKLGVQSMAMDPGQFGTFIKEQLEVNTELVKAAGISAK